MLKILKVTIIFLFVSNCGYVPIYSDINNTKIKITIKNLKGERNINNIIAQKLSIYKNPNTDKNYIVNVFSKYEKISLTKNAAGDTTNFRLVIKVDFFVNFNENSQTISFEEKFDIKKGSTIFEQQNYEKIVIRNMVNNITKKFISQLLKIE